MLPPDQEQLLETLLELRPDGPALVVIMSRRLTAGAEIGAFLSSRLGFDVVDVLVGAAPLDPTKPVRRRFVHGLPFLSPQSRRALLDRLNRGRDLIERLSLQLVIWSLEEDTDELASVAPDLAAWIDEYVRWEGPPEIRQLYAAQAFPPNLAVNLHQRNTRGGRPNAPVVLLPDDLAMPTDIGRVSALIGEVESLGLHPRVVARPSIIEPPPEHPSVVDDVLQRPPHQATSVLFLRGISHGELELDLEYSEIQHAAEQYGHTVCTATATSPTELHAALLDHPSSILHFAGHSQGPNLLLLLEPVAIHPRAFRRILETASAHHHFQCIVLNTSASSGLAHLLLEPPAVTSCVITGSEALSDRDAVSFSAAFYPALFQGLSIRAAFDRALAAIEIEHSTQAPYALLGSS